MELGRYRLIAELARGGMGVIHLAEARGPGGFEKLVVVKELKRDLTGNPVYTSMFLDEARLAARLTHRHIVQTHEVGCEDGRYFMALELLEGGSLHQVRGKLGVRALPVNMGVRVLAAVLEALDHAHDLTDGNGRALGVVHRDVSPHNVFLTFAGDVKLIDFGVAKSRDRRAEDTTRLGVVKGSVPYMSPDHVDGTTIDRRADVFAVGVLLRELLTGERLWGEADELSILRRLIARDLPAFPASADVPRALRAITEQAMAPRRGDRYSTAAAMREALEAYLEEADPRGSLADLGVWLGRTLKEERAAFKALVRRGRAASPNSAITALQARVWLPSSELHTRFSGVPVPPALPAPATSAMASLRAARGSRAGFFGAGALFAGALALVALGLSPHRPGEVSSFEREPRAAPDHVAVSVVKVTAAAPEAPELAEEPAPGAALAERAFAEAASAATAPATVLREAPPPNPYDDRE